MHVFGFRHHIENKLSLQNAQYFPCSLMVRTIRDNEVAAGAMDKNVKGRHLQIFELGPAVIGIAGAMLTTLMDG